MKVLHISCGNRGGAYQVASDLCQLQNEHGYQSILLTGSDRSFIAKVFSKFYTVLNQILTQRDFGILSLFSLNSFSKKKILSYESDVVHIHNWFNAFSIRGIQKLSAVKPVVITLHDERLITGGCHNHLSCSNIAYNCNTCPALTIPVHRAVAISRKRSNKLLNNPKISVVTPSAWLRNEINEFSKRSAEVYIVANPVQFSLQSKINKKNSSNNRDIIKIGFVAADPWVPLKGFKELLLSLNEINKSKKYQIHLDVAGEVKKEVALPDYVHTKGVLRGAQLTAFFKEQDYIVVPSLSENFPSVIREAQLASTVVIATNVGGIPEMIENNKTGFLQQNGESLTSLLIRAFATDETIIKSVQSSSLSHAQEQSSRDKIFKEYENIYLKAIRHG
jgi:glycosyltransferase involved in cell wall biosynthesis